MTQTQASAHQGGIATAESASTSTADTQTVLAALREALHPNDILTALQILGLNPRDLAEGIGTDQRTIRRWLAGQEPTHKHGQTIGTLRLVAIHIVQRRGLPIELVARWLRLPDSELRFQTPLAAIADGRFKDVLVAYDEYVSPRPGSLQREMSPAPGTELGKADIHSQTDEFTAVPAR
jgi:DNA-binding transcriptional regulator YiaG